MMKMFDDSTTVPNTVKTPLRVLSVFILLFAVIEVWMHMVLIRPSDQLSPHIFTYSFIVCLLLYLNFCCVLIHILWICLVSVLSYVRICFSINTTILQLSSFITCDEYVYFTQKRTYMFWYFDIFLFYVSILSSVFWNRVVNIVTDRNYR